MENLIGFFLPLIIMIAIFYFILIRPQNKERAKLQQMVSELKKGDKVITSSGIIGRIEMINNDKGTFVINSEGSKLLISKDAVVALESTNEA
ncbi:MAG: preprotein translocase subunit YajC [Mycoplasmatales bacterium]